MNVVELATLIVGGLKQDDFREKEFDPEKLMESGINYRGELPNYEVFTRRYREGVNSPSMDYGFLCFYRIAEGVIELRRKRTAVQEGREKKDVPRPSMILEGEVVEGEEADYFPPEMQGESLWKAYKELEDERAKVVHAFLYNEDPVGGHENIIADRFEGEEQAATRRARARYIARRMLDSEFWASSESG